ncbi:E-selectin-like [Mytilus trossulus]|uniref:E-selectin-like n=1 Tax=Mytilus trossulus TaxID=6551 RepID=UPI003006B908
MPLKRTGYHYPDSVDFQCGVGYTIYGANRSKCLASGNWSHQPPTCNAVSCPDLPSSSYMKIPTKLTGYHYPDSLDFQCEIGYQVNGANNIECLSTGSWSHQPPTCNAVSCPDLPSSSNMKIPTKLKGYHYHDSVDFQCEIGYQVNGANNIECLSTGSWSHQPPTCNAVSCPDLPSSSYMKTPTKLKGYHYHDSVDFQCEIGYQVNGANNIECLSTGSWSHQPSTCNGKY